MRRRYKSRNTEKVILVIIAVVILGYVFSSMGGNVASCPVKVDEVMDKLYYDVDGYLDPSVYIPREVSVDGTGFHDTNRAEPLVMGCRKAENPGENINYQYCGEKYDSPNLLYQATPRVTPDGTIHDPIQYHINFVVDITDCEKYPDGTKTCRMVSYSCKRK